MINPQEVQSRIERFPTMCRQAGLKVTPQRVAVYNMLAATDSHPTPEAIYTAIRPILPSVSLGTVYKILDLLDLKGILQRVATAEQAARYDARVDGHHHAMCIRCGRIDDIGLDELIDTDRLRSINGFETTQAEVLVRGVCSECRLAA